MGKALARHIILYIYILYYVQTHVKVCMIVKSTPYEYAADFVWKFLHFISFADQESYV